jgi:formylglycine-generating enzyme required for sulfatase activity
MNCGRKLPEGVNFCSGCGAKVSAPETSPKVTGGMDNSVAIRSPGAGSVYAPSTSIIIGTEKEREKEKRYCDLCKNEISGKREFAPCTHCGKLMCNMCADNYKLLAGNLEIPEELCEEYFEPLCWDCWKAVKAEINRLELDREQIKKKQEEEERLRREKEEWERPKTIINSISMDFVLIPAGEFTMGSEYDDDEQPVHNVKIKTPFYLGMYSVTQREWKTVMGDNPSYFEGDDLPVECVSWDDVQEFIKKLNTKEGTDQYRLPSEAEWEYASRAGTTTRYSFGDSDSKLGEYAWYEDNSDRKTHPVGEKKPNQWGLFDMHGNVWEWMQDTYHEDYDCAPTDGSAWAGSGARRGIRGGGRGHFADSCGSASRSFNFHDELDLGFRLVREV